MDTFRTDVDGAAAFTFDAVYAEAKKHINLSNILN